MEARLITVNDLYAFEPGGKVSLDPFIDIIGRHFKQPKEGLGFDNSPTAHMWRTMMYPGQSAVKAHRSSPCEGRASEGGWDSPLRGSLGLSASGASLGLGPSGLARTRRSAARWDSRLRRSLGG